MNHTEFVLEKTKKEQKKKAQKGFTLVELLVVIAIIAILAAVAIPQYTKYKRKAAASTAASALTTCITTLGTEYADNGTTSLDCTVGSNTVTLNLDANGILQSKSNISATVNGITVNCSITVDTNGQAQVECNPA